MIALVKKVAAIKPWDMVRCLKRLVIVLYVTKRVKVLRHFCRFETRRNIASWIIQTAKIDTPGRVREVYWDVKIGI